jgi:5-methylcytosine-specific restriction enzyme A
LIDKNGFIHVDIGRGNAMPVSFDSLVPGEVYDRPYLAKLWGYQDWHALGRGIFTPAKQNFIILFVTGEKQKSLVQYRDYFQGDTLRMDGEENHANDERIVKSISSGEKMRLFYRDRHHQPFIYIGEATLERYELKDGNGPSTFYLHTQRSDAVARNSLVTERLTHGEIDESIAAAVEGQRHIRRHATYERNIKNRAAAIRLHGTTCRACGFNFDSFYGAELARSYVEIHHLESIASGEREINPSKDLAPLCANCHSMVHRTTGAILPINELVKMIKSNRRNG